jgi:hypothetical protein
MTIESAAIALSTQIFGELRAYHRLGIVKPADGILHVYTPVAPARWPASRAKNFHGFPVMWHRVTSAADKAEEGACEI